MINNMKAERMRKGAEVQRQNVEKLIYGGLAIDLRKRIRDIMDRGILGSRFVTCNHRPTLTTTLYMAVL